MPSPNDPYSQDSFHALRRFCMFMACICVVSVFVLCYYRHWMPAVVAAALTSFRMKIRRWKREMARRDVIE